MRIKDIRENARAVIGDAVSSSTWEPYNNGDYYPTTDEKFEATYLGTVFALLPSGKYYTPFACSNITEKEAMQDEIWYQEAQKEADKHNCWLENGEGDPCDLFLVRSVANGD